MKLLKDEPLFFGCKVDSKMREALAQARPGDRKYFEGDSDEFLRICSMDDKRWIGKIVKPGLNTNEVEDIQRNIVSILRRISPTIRIASNAVKVFATAPSDEVIDLGDDGVDEEDDDSSGGGEESGPYISY